MKRSKFAIDLRGGSQPLTSRPQEGGKETTVLEQLKNVEKIIKKN